MAGHPVAHAHDGSDGSGTPATLWPSPLQVATSSLVAYWDADVSVVADATAIGTIPDLSGTGRDLTQSSTKRPTLQNNIINGHRIYRFDGSDDNATVSVTVAQPATIFVAFKMVTWAASGYVFDSNAGTHRIALFGNGGSGMSFYAGNSVTVTSGAPANGSSYLFVCQANGASSKVWKNGGAAFISGDIGADSTDGFRYGSRYNEAAGSFPASDLKCGAVYSAALSLSQINLIANGIAAQLSLTWTTAT